MAAGNYVRSQKTLEKMRVSALKFHREHPGFQKEINNRPEVKVKYSVAKVGVPKSEIHKAAMRGPRPCMGGNKNPNHGKGLFGEDNGNWHGGVNNPYHPNFTEAFRKIIRDRDNHQCRLCDKLEEENGQKLDVHHVYADKNNNCKLFIDFISLCVTCHRKVDCCSDQNFNYYEEYLEDLICVGGGVL